MSRFPDRNVRLVRQRESAAFRDVIMPVCILIGFLGVLGMVLLVVDNHLNDRWEADAFAVAASAASVPALALLIRWLRGHFHKDLKNP